MFKNALVVLKAFVTCNDTTDKLQNDCITAIKYHNLLDYNNFKKNEAEFDISLQ